MQKIITKSLTSVALASAVALPLVASSAYGRTDSPANSASLSNLGTSNLIVAGRRGNPVPQQFRKCEYDKNIDLSPAIYIASCMKQGTLNGIDPIMQDQNLSRIKKYALGIYSNKRDPRNSSPEAKKAYRVLTNPVNLRPSSEWAN